MGFCLWFEQISFALHVALAESTRSAIEETATKETSSDTLSPELKNYISLVQIWSRKRGIDSLAMRKLPRAISWCWDALSIPGIPPCGQPFLL